MLHKFPENNWEPVWRALEALVEDQAIKSLGVTNISASELKQLYKFARVKPSAIQVKFSPYCMGNYFDPAPAPATRQLFHFCYDHGIAIFGVSVFDKVWQQLCPLEDGVILHIAKSMGSSPAAVLLRWVYSYGLGAVVRSTSAAHLQELQLAGVAGTLHDFHRDLISSLSFLTASPMKIPTLANDLFCVDVDQRYGAEKPIQDHTPRVEQDISDKNTKSSDLQQTGGFTNEELSAAVEVLSGLLVSGDWAATIQKVGEAYRRNLLDAAFTFVITQQIKQSEEKGYRVKHRVFMGILDHIKTLKNAERTKHAPVYDSDQVQQPSTTARSVPVESLENIIDLCFDLENTTTHKQAAEHLKTHGFAVFENSFPLEEIAQLKKEFVTLRPHFQESEIWVFFKFVILVTF